MYTDVQFRPAIRITDALDVRFPIRIYYNNGVGPQQVHTSRATPQNFITVDTLTLAQSDKIRYWNQRPLLTYKTENRNIGLNIPVNIAYTIPSDPRWRLLFGLNFDFAWVTNRRLDFSYIANSLDSTAFVVNTVRDVPAPPFVTDIAVLNQGHVVRVTTANPQANKVILQGGQLVYTAPTNRLYLRGEEP